MEAVSLKLDDTFLKRIVETMKKHHYTTKTEFIREAIRDHIENLEKAELLRRVESIAGSSKHRTTDEDLHHVREELARKHLANLK